MKKPTHIALLFAATPVSAASGPFLSLANTDFIVLLSFLVFIAILVYFGLPAKVAGFLDDRAAQVAMELEEARALKEEAVALLTSYERKQKEAEEQAKGIVAAAHAEAEAIAKQTQVDLEAMVARRLLAAEERVQAVERKVAKDLRNMAVEIAVQAAGDVLFKKMTAAAASKEIDAAIDYIESRPS